MRRHSPLLPRSVRLALALAIGLIPTAAAAQQQAAGAAGQAQANDETEDPRLAVIRAENYIEPPPEIRDAVLATTIEDLRISNLDPTGQLFLRTVGDGFPSLASFSKPHYNLGQFQVDPLANRNRRLTTRSDVGIEIYDANAQLVTRVNVPDGARVSNAQWSPDGSRVAFFAHFDDATHIYLADRRNGSSRRLTRSPVLATHVTSFQWTDDGEHIVTVLVPENRGGEPPAPPVPETPKVRITSPERNSLRTYFDLLENPFEKQLVHFFSTGQLARIAVDSRRVENIGEPAMIRSVSASPDGDYFRVTVMKPELSYIVPTSNAGSIESIWNAQGEVLAQLNERDLNESAQGGGRGGRGGGAGGNQQQKRQLSWRPDGGPGMIFLQRAPRDSAAGADAPRPDRVMFWLPPFDDNSVEVVYESETEIQSVDFDESGRMLFLTREADDIQTAHAVSLDDPSRTEYLIYEWDTGEELENPGSLVSRNGRVLVSADGAYVLLSGVRRFEDPLENAPRPFLDRVEIRTGQKQRVFESAPDVYETFDFVRDDAFNEIVITRQSRTMKPNQWVVNLATGERRQITFNEDHHPRITAARREMLTVTRPDGFKSRVTVTLPADYQPGTPLPAMFWFYPREYSEQDQYDRTLRNYNKNDFPNVGARSMQLLTLLGYAVVEPDLPIVGPEGQRNDEYPHDLRNTLAAVIDSLSARGWIDRDRLAIGGHSYGAFGTANAMIQTPFFKAGIAGDGNYNRSLTPAGFQSERRWLWEAQDLYIEMSPFFQADRLTGALLMYHGEDDHNVGTAPIHALRMYHALEVLGKTASLYMYPFEDHGPATRETTLDLWARWVAWLDLYVKNPGTGARVTTNDDSAGG